MNWKNGGFKKGQSAMEYLMTYGWAILVIAVVLAALFELGVFSGGTGLPNACVGQSGFQCTLISAGANNVVIQLGQISGNTWAPANVALFNSSVVSNVANPAAYSQTSNSVGIASLSSGVTTTVTVPISWYGALSPGSPVSGQLWVQYKYNSNTYYAEIGTVTAKLS